MATPCPLPHAAGIPLPERPKKSQDMAGAEGADPGVAPRKRQVNRARLLKMTEQISPAALDRWNTTPEYEKRVMIQVGTRNAGGRPGGMPACLPARPPARLPACLPCFCGWLAGQAAGRAGGWAGSWVGD